MGAAARQDGAGRAEECELRGTSAWPPRVVAVLYWTVALGLAAYYLRFHVLVAYTFPVPWFDESVFMWQALAFAKHGSLYAPEIHPARTFFWGPPGYMVAIGAVFKFVAFSLGRARLVSALLVVGSFLLLASLIARYRARVVSLLLLSAVFLISAPTVASGNVSRMESLLLFIVCSGTVLVQKGDDYKGLAILCAAPLVHPNGVYFAAAGALYIVLSGRLRERGLHVRGSDRIIVLTVVALWLWFAVYIVLNWADFHFYMALQMQRKLQRNIWTQLFGGGREWFLVVALVCALCGRRDKTVMILLMVAIPAWLACAIGHEIWYQMFNSLAYALVSISVLQIATHLAVRVTAFHTGRSTVAGAVGVALLAWNYVGGRLEPPPDYRSTTGWGGMRVIPEFVYENDTEATAVRAFLDSLRSSGRPVHVSFYPEADSLFFHDQEGGAVRFIQPAIGFGGADRIADADVRIVHLSRCLPAWMNQEAKTALRNPSGDDATNPQVLVSRERTEVWYYRFTHARPLR